ncbi:unnamed protein product [Polarella glacialis]|uniref:Uncharacterized protein n=1 Tax=Polarella glacialis TaxID=89957 RepID=A0A813HGZ9_POLGL|nr:unnamed protein product [Polarella glacialis]
MRCGSGLLRYLKQLLGIGSRAAQPVLAFGPPPVVGMAAAHPEESAAEYKAFVDAWVVNLKQMQEVLIGRDHQKERSEKGKEIADLHAEPRYIDACRVAKGQPPVQGYFASEAESISFVENPGSSVPSEEAARMAAGTESALKELEPPHTPEDLASLIIQRQWRQLKKGSSASIGSRGKEPDVNAVRLWQWRVAKLEVKTTADRMEATASENIDELESIAIELVKYRAQLQHDCGYRNKDLREDAELSDLERRLDRLAAVILAEPALPESESVRAAAGQLRQREHHLVERLAQHREETAGLSPSEACEAGQLVAEIADLKAELKAHGLAEHEQDREERVMMKSIRLRGIRMKVHHDKKHVKQENKELWADRQQLERLTKEIEALKQELCEEHGFSHKDVKQDSDIRELEERPSVERRHGTRSHQGHCRAGISNS